MDELQIVKRKINHKRQEISLAKGELKKLIQKMVLMTIIDDYEKENNLSSAQFLGQKIDCARFLLED